MQINLAGFNLDTDVIARLKTKSSDTGADITPETISAAYARISRDPRPVNELRTAARAEVEKARHSNRSIIFKMGHHSVAEHAVFNFDIIGVSRLAIEEIEKFRLCSFTEKSQRYITLDGDFVIPAEIKGSALEKDFLAAIKDQNELYFRLIDKGIINEDARYITALATQGQLGLTVNARNLELIFRRFASSQLAEVRELGQKMYGCVEKVAPSIILFTAANAYDRATYPALKENVRKLKSSGKPDNILVKLINATPHADNMVAAALIHTSSSVPFAAALKKAQQLSVQAKTELFKTTSKFMQLYDVVLREFEHVDLTFELVISAGAFSQLKRHRMATITGQPYDPALGLTIPESITAVGLEKEFRKVIAATEKVYNKILKANPLAAPYILTNAHRRRVLFKCNAREFYHFSRLREDSSTQWDIRNLAHEMTSLARKKMPLTMLMIGAKDKYTEIYQRVFGRSNNQRV